MLLRLEIQNIALIDEVSIELGEGLNILTGETGAGKSIIIDSINILLGERFSKELIRTGKDKALIEAVFQIDNSRMAELYEKYGIEPETDGTLIISREFNIAGRSICRVNGRLVTVSALKEIGGYLIDVHGQYDNQSLLKSETHIELLDAFGGEKIQALKKRYSELYEKRKDIKNSLQKLFGDEKDRERKIDLLKYQIDEIKKAKLAINEEEELNKQKTLLSNAGKIAEVLSSVYEMLFTGTRIKTSAYDDINEAVLKLKDISSYDEKYDRITKKLEDISYQLEDIREEIRNERDSIEYNPYLLEQIEERLDLVFRLKRKYGNSILEILEYCKNSEEELDKIIKSEEYINELQKQLSEVDNSLYALAKEINRTRAEVAVILESNICKELEALEMKKARFKVGICMEDITEDSMTGGSAGIKFKPNGLDKVEFLISPNVGEPLKPLSKIASGGEMARIMLAIKSILADVDKIPTLIFDEIDIGISGKVSQRVGEKLAFLSKNHQVICVTHHPQIASMADNHFLIEKIVGKNITKIKVSKLSGEKIPDEVARILGGDLITDMTRNLACEMLENAKKFKRTAIH
ncbi:MAG: DNA repair protein RecN [Firmicutes bacterium]|nr:DNA repair protein RecN [Bacillota bacterium]